LSQETLPLIIGPRDHLRRQIDDRRGLGIGQQGFGTTIGQQGTTPIAPATVPPFGPNVGLGRGLIIGPQGFATTFGEQGIAFVPQFSSGFIPHRSFGLIGPQTTSTTVGSQIIALAISAQNSQITIGPQGVGVGNTVGQQMLSPSAMLQQTRTFSVRGIPHTVFAGRVTQTTSRGH
jgi:hypothetical protein